MRNELGMPTRAEGRLYDYLENEMMNCLPTTDKFLTIGDCVNSLDECAVQDFGRTPA
jgi:hypothetical protein